MSARTWTVSLATALVLAGGWAVASRHAATPVLRSAHSEPAGELEVERVVVTEAGKTFHKDGCPFIHGPASVITGGQAVARGYTPCTRCLPR